MFLSKLRQQLEQWLGPWVGQYLTVLHAIRQHIKAQEKYPLQRAEQYKAVLNDMELLQAVEQGRVTPATITPQWLKDYFS